MRIYILAFFALVNLAFAQKGSHEKFGLPKGNTIIKRQEFIYSVNQKTGFVDWLVYRVGKDDFGTVPRWEKAFFRDSLINLKIALPTNADYENSGYDKGHLLRSEERTTTVEANRQTFVLTNVLPQTPDLNRGPWLDLERWVEKACKDSTYEIWVATGPIFDTTFYKLNGKYLIPKYCFKVLLIKTPDGKFKKIGVVMPNVTGVRNKKWADFITPITEIEKVTNLKFFEKFK
jgi:endonuclease G